MLQSIPPALRGRGYTPGMYIFLLILSISAAFACQNDAIVISRRTGISINSNGNNSGTATQKVNIPVRFNGKWGCWEQEGGLTFDVKEKSRSMTVIIPKSKFKDLPGRTASYAFLRKDELGRVDLDIATFVCMGDTVVAAETYSGDVDGARMIQNVDVQINTTFSTGAAAAQLSRRLGRTNEMPGGLQEYFEEKFTGQWSALEKYDVMVPSVYLGASMRSPLSNLSSSYNTRVVTKSACSAEFESIMAPLRFENLRIPKGIRTRVKKGNLVLSW